VTDTSGNNTVTEEETPEISLDSSVVYMMTDTHGGYSMYEVKYDTTYPLSTIEPYVEDGQWSGDIKGIPEATLSANSEEVKIKFMDIGGDWLEMISTPEQALNLYMLLDNWVKKDMSSPKFKRFFEDKD